MGLDGETRSWAAGSFLLWLSSLRGLRLDASLVSSARDTPGSQHRHFLGIYTRSPGLQTWIPDPPVQISSQDRAPSAFMSFIKNGKPGLHPSSFPVSEDL